MKQNLWKIAGVFLIADLCAYAVYFRFLGIAPRQDWDYFNALSLLINSTVHVYHHFPIHDPWMCGGLDLWSNPQTRIFSPFGLLDIFLAPYAANLVSLLVYSYIGLWGCYLLLRFLNVSEFVAVICSIFFINSAWFGLHFIAGHIPFGSIQLIPGMIYLFLSAEKPRSFVALALASAFMLLDGGIYAFIFSFYAALTAWAVGLGRMNYSKIKDTIVRNWKLMLFTCFTCGLLLAPKLIPMKVIGHLRDMRQEINSLRVTDLGQIFFNPFQYPKMPMDSFVEFRYHEFGAYIGILAVALIAWAFFDHDYRSRNRKIGLAVLFWIWTGTGWGEAFNPWMIHILTPFHRAHVQSRVFIIAIVFVMILLAFALERLQNRKRVFATLVMCLLFESFFVRNYPASVGFRDDSMTADLPSISSTKITKTIKVAKYKPEHYYASNVGSKYCYEPAYDNSRVKYSDEMDYLGEVYGDGEIEIERYTPGEIELRYSLLGVPAHLGVNTNVLAGWNIDPHIGKDISVPEGTLKLEMFEQNGRTKLTYWPGYANFVLISYTIGVIFAIGLLVHTGRKETHVSANSAV